MIRRPKINGRRKAPKIRALVAGASERIRDAAMAIEERVAWPVTDRARGAFEVLRWPFERAAWAMEQRVVWPLGDRVAAHGVPGPALAAGVALLAVCAVAAGAIVAGGGGEKPTVAAAPAGAPVETAPTPAPGPEAPVLHGTAPDFTPEGGDAGAKVANRDTVIAAKPDAATSTSSSTSSGAPSSAATLSKVGEKTANPGPAAIQVARRFSGAFVLYETGRDEAKVRATFDATASPRLKQALLRRPPRLPANVKVPKAKVLNVVPGPRHGNTFTLSASLLRVGITSELRIDVQRDEKSGEWQVTDVLG